MLGQLQFIRFIRVAMFEIERRADVSHDFENCCVPLPKTTRTAMMNSNQRKNMLVCDARHGGTCLVPQTLLVIAEPRIAP